MRGAALSALLLLSSWTPALRAQAPPQQQADELIAAGVAMRKDGRESEAFELFRQAYELHPSPRARGQMGLAAKSVRRYVEAERYLHEALASADDDWVKQNREALELARDIVGKQLASLLVLSNVEGADLLVNGGSVATLPLAEPVRVPAGAARLELRANGYLPGQTETTLPAGTTIELRIELEPVPPPPPAAARAPAAPKPAPRPAPPPERASWLPYILTTAGVGAVWLGVGTYFGVRTLMKKDERDEICGEDTVCEPGQEAGLEADQAARTAATWSTVSFAVGGSAVAAAIVLWIVEPKQSPSTRVVVAPTAGGGLIGVNGSF